MPKLAVIGDRESALGFKALGLDTCFANTTEEARSTLHRLAKADYTVIYITEQLASQIKQDISAYKDNPDLAIILIPGKSGNLGIGLDAVYDAVERAVGANILNDN